MGSLALGKDIDGDLKALLAGSDGDAAEWADIAEITAPGEGDVAV